MLRCVGFPLRGIDTDNGSEFINETLLAYCGRHSIEFTRSRPNRKNDQAWVEQKNGSVGICFATLWYSAELRLVSVDFTKEMP